MITLLLPCCMAAGHLYGQTAPVRHTIQAAYTRADKAAGRLDPAEMYADCAPDYAERYNGFRIGLKARREATKVYFQSHPNLSQVTDVEKVTLHGFQATVIVRKYQHCTFGYGAAGMTVPGTPGTHDFWIMNIWTMRDVWQKIGPRWLRVFSDPLSTQMIWNNGSGTGLQHEERTMKSRRGSGQLN